MSAKHIADSQATDEAPGPDHWQVYCDGCQTILTVAAASAGLPIPCEGCGDFLIVPKQRVATGSVIGDYILREPLGEGGRGAVFKAYQQSLDRPCAVKILHAAYASQGNRHDELIREARLAARLNHPHIVQCYAVGDDHGMVYYAMEFVAGRSLQEILKSRTKIMPARALDILRQVVVALEYAWREQRLLHRDVKPDNIMIGDDGLAKLTDFGLACPAHEAPTDADDVISGTPQYMSPEQIMGEAMDYRGDLYSIGVILYQCVTGKAPFTGPNHETILKRQLDEYPPYPHVVQGDIPQALSEMIMKMLAKSPADRFADFDDLVAQMDRCRSLCPDLGSSTVISRSDLYGSQQMALRPVAKLPVANRRSARQLKVVTAGDSELNLPAKLDLEATVEISASDTRPAPPAATVSEPTPATDELPEATPPKGKTGPALAVIVVLLLALAGGGAAMMMKKPADTGLSVAPPAITDVDTEVSRSIPAADTEIVEPTSPVMIATPPPQPVPQLQLTRLLPDPAGYDPGHEWAEISAIGDGTLDLTGWSLRDAQDATQPLDGMLADGETRRIRLVDIYLNNGGDSLMLIDADGTVVDRIDYEAAEVVEDTPIERRAE